MKNPRLITKAATGAAIAALALAACSQASATDNSNNQSTGSSETSDATTAATADSQPDAAYTDLIEANMAAHEVVTLDEASATAINLDSTDTEAASGTEFDGGTLTINQPGTYLISGELDGGQIVVNVPDGEVGLILNGVSITAAESAAIHIVAGDTTIELAAGSQNTLVDAAEYVTDENDEPKAALYAADDLTIIGEGALSVTGQYNDAISSKDGLVIAGGQIQVTAVDDGIRGQDYLLITDGNITVEADGDGLKSDEDSDDSAGWVRIDGGEVTITAGDDGIQTQTDALLGAGRVTITTDGVTSDTDTATDSTASHAVSSEVVTAVADAEITLDASADGLHSNGDVLIFGGTTEIAAGDDAIHADAAAVIHDGIVTVTSSTEGLEGTQVAIHGGSVQLTATDDAINAAGDLGTPELTVSGGTVILDAEGDGFDSNGNATMTGGTVVVHGPQGSGNGAIDVNGTFEISGGELIAVGSSGMAQSPDQNSTQPWFAATFSTLAAGELLQITDETGAVLASLETKGGVSSVVYSSPALSEDGSYTVWTGGTATGSGPGLLSDGDVSGGASEIATTGVRSAVAGGMPGSGGPGGSGAPGDMGGPGGSGEAPDGAPEGGPGGNG